ncbi:MAG: hypothetical protein BAJATHORv1_30450 [Candidatus Thorarchaeota archaeon]|nr:MAG: hypothetical protein BAJATHORv1_30450 [Candidatus Thorarchaeota archaeon]
MGNISSMWTALILYEPWLFPILFFLGTFSCENLLNPIHVVKMASILRASLV